MQYTNNLTLLFIRKFGIFNYQISIKAFAIENTSYLFQYSIK